MPIQTATQAQTVFGAPTVDPRRLRRKPNVVSTPVDNRRWDQKVGDWGRDAGSGMVPGILGGVMKGIDTLVEGVAMSNENKRWFQENVPNAKRYAGVPMGVRESVMTGRDKKFYDKYMDLAAVEGDRERKQYYLDQADTARRNAQITRRINYGLGQMDLDETPFKGYESYDPGFAGFEGETGPRFDIDRFRGAMSEYLPGGEDITERVTEDFVPYDVDTGYGWEDEDIVEDEPLDFDWTDLWMTDKEDDLLGEFEGLAPPEEETEEITETFTDLGDTHDFTESWKTAFDATDYIDVQEYVKIMSNTEGSLWYGKDEDWIVKDMIKRNYIKEK